MRSKENKIKFVEVKWTCCSCLLSLHSKKYFEIIYKKKNRLQLFCHNLSMALYQKLLLMHDDFVLSAWNRVFMIRTRALSA